MSAVSVGPVVALRTSKGAPRYCSVLRMAPKAASVPSAVMINARASMLAPAIALAPVTGALSTADPITSGRRIRVSFDDGRVDVTFLGDHGLVGRRGVTSESPSQRRR